MVGVTVRVTVSVVVDSAVCVTVMVVVGRATTEGRLPERAASSVATAPITPATSVAPALSHPVRAGWLPCPPGCATVASKEFNW